MVNAAEMVQREFQARRRSFRAFCDQHAVTEASVVRFLTGRGSLHHEVVRELAETIGLDVRHLRRIAA